MVQTRSRCRLQVEADGIVFLAVCDGHGVRHAQLLPPRPRDARARESRSPRLERHVGWAGGHKKFWRAVRKTKMSTSRLDRRVAASRSLRGYPLCRNRRGRRGELPSRYTKSSRSAPTWRANCQMVRSGQPTGVLIPVVYLFGGEVGS
jgi:hypothetical protein